MRSSRPVCAAFGFLVLAVLACSMPFQATPVPTAPPAQQAGASPTPPASEPSTPRGTPTPIGQRPGAPETPAAAEEADCTFDADFVSDVSIPDDTVMEPGTAFVKTWRVRNDSTCAWDAQTQLVFDGGDRMDGPEMAPVGAVEAGAEVDLSVNLEAPTAPGTYRGNWQLETAAGRRFGPVLYLRIVIPEPTATPTATPEPTETLEPTETPTGTAEACLPAHPDLEQVLDLAQDEGYAIGCPTGESYILEDNGAMQEFWANVDEENPSFHYRSLMIWRPDTERIYVIDGVHTSAASEGDLFVYSDTWDESQPHVPPDCADLTVPEGYRLPERGFGKIWCQEELMDELGWPDAPESAVELLVQPTENGLLMRTVGPEATYLIALLPDAGEAIAVWPTP